MSRWEELLTHLRYERRHPRARVSPLALLRKLALAVPQGFAFALFNFGSSFRSTPRPQEPRPRAPELIAQLDLGVLRIGGNGMAWPARADGTQSGLPFSDGTVASVTFHDYELVEDPVRALTEIHRVCRSGAEVRVMLRGEWADPRQRRVAKTAAVAATVEDHQLGSELGLAGLFEVAACQSGLLTLVARKGTSQEHPQRIDLGCGHAKRVGYCGIDIAPLPGVDVVRDVVRDGLPFSDGTIAAVSAVHFLEHVEDLVFVMNEVHRVCCEGALVDIEVPTLLGPWAAADPTHRRLFNARSFGYFIEDADNYEPGYAGIKARFQLIEQRVSTTMRVTLRAVKRGTPTA